METIQVKTSSRTQMIDITSEINTVTKNLGITDGLCTVYVPHTTAAVTINENADPCVVRDILMETDKVIPLKDGYTHMEGNSAAHIKSSLFGCSSTIIVSEGALKLGTWQSVFFCEFDGPRTRKVWVQITGS